MSARLKLKNMKKQMELLHANCEEKIFKAKAKEAECRRLLFENIVELGIDIRLTPHDILKAANDYFRYNVEKAAHSIANKWAESLSEYIANELENEYRINRFTSLKVRVFAPRPNKNHVKVEMRELF